MSPSAVKVPGSATPSRAIDVSWLFWIAMLAASALGTNLGDFCAEGLSLGLGASFAGLALASVLLAWGDRRLGLRTEVLFWAAIVVLRAAATNVGDFLTHGLGFGYVSAALLLGAATLAAGALTIASRPANASPDVDARYWVAMAVGGVFGTIGGDLVSHTLGLAMSATLLTVVLLGTLGARTYFAPAAVLGYWCVVLAERSAGTAIGDLLAEGRGIGLGLPVAMVLTGGALLVALSLRAAGLKVPGMARA